MARFAANAGGEILDLRPTYLAERLSTAPPAGTAYTLRFDETTNPGLIEAYQANPAAFAMPGGTLTQDGTPATVNPPALFYDAFSSAADMLAKARSDQPHNWTTQEIDRIAELAFRGAGLV